MLRSQRVLRAEVSRPHMRDSVEQTLLQKDELISRIQLLVLCAENGFSDPFVQICHLKAFVYHDFCQLSKVFGRAFNVGAELLCILDGTVNTPFTPLKA